MLNRETLIDFLELFKRAKGIQDYYYDKCYTAVYAQKFGDRIAYDDVFNALFHVKNLINLILDDIAPLECILCNEPSCLSAIDSLKKYLKQLLDCQEKLNGIVSKLHEKSNGSLFSYSYFRYAKDNAMLNHAMRVLESDANKLQDDYEIMLYSLAT